MANKNGKAPKAKVDDELDAEALEQMRADAGAGLEDIAPGDLGLPIWRMIQSGSKEAKRGNEMEIPGAREGMWFDTVSRELYDEVIVVPCKVVTHYVEWIPIDQGGGFVRKRIRCRHAESVLK